MTPYRKHCSIFDVSHMLQTRVHGNDRVEFCEALTVADVQNLKTDTGTLSVFTNDKGGIIDDLIVTKTSRDYIYLVTNAGCRDKDLILMKRKEEEMKREGKDVRLEHCDEHGLVAVQGPESAQVLKGFISEKVDLNKFKFMSSAEWTMAGIGGCRVTRCG